MAKHTTAKEITGQHVEDLTTEVEGLKDEVRVLRDVLDEVRSDLEWLVRNLRIADVPRPFQLTSMPADPCVDDFHERVNTLQAEDMTTDSKQQQALWNDDTAPNVATTHDVDSNGLTDQ